MLDLDVSNPEELPRVLRATAEKYRASAAELQAAWQDDNAGRVWSAFADTLERAAERADRDIAKHFR
jgi:hypothetical protein